MPDEEHIADSLEKLVALCREGESGYREAAEHVTDPELKKLLHEVSRERARFAADLQKQAVRRSRSNAARPAHILKAVHRGWVGLRAALGGDNAVLAAVESRDRYIQEKYDQYIRDGRLPDDILGIIRNQAQAIVGTLDRIRALRRSRKAA